MYPHIHTDTDTHKCYLPCWAKRFWANIREFKQNSQCTVHWLCSPEGLAVGRQTNNWSHMFSHICHKLQNRLLAPLKIYGSVTQVLKIAWKLMNSGNISEANLQSLIPFWSQSSKTWGCVRINLYWGILKSNLGNSLGHSWKANGLCSSLIHQLRTSKEFESSTYSAHTHRKNKKQSKIFWSNRKPFQNNLFHWALRYQPWLEDTRLRNKLKTVT